MQPNQKGTDFLLIAAKKKLLQLNFKAEEVDFVEMADDAETLEGAENFVAVPVPQFEEVTGLRKLVVERNVRDERVLFFGICHQILKGQKIRSDDAVGDDRWPGGLQYNGTRFKYWYYAEQFYVSVMEDAENCFLSMSSTENEARYAVIKVEKVNIPKLRLQTLGLDHTLLTDLFAKVWSFIKSFCDKVAVKSQKLDSVLELPQKILDKSKRRRTTGGVPERTEMYDDLKERKGEEELSDKRSLFGVLISALERVGFDFNFPPERLNTWAVPLNQESNVFEIVFRNVILKMSLVNDEKDFFACLWVKMNDSKFVAQKIYSEYILSFDEDDVEEDDDNIRNICRIAGAIEEKSSTELVRGSGSVSGRSSSGASTPRQQI